MKKREISKSDALKLITKVEDHFFDKKALAINGKSVQKISVAFANADGGEFLVGISDDKEENDPLKRWIGASKPEDFNHHLQNIAQINPTLDYFCELLSCSDFSGLVLRIVIEKSSEVNKTSDNTVYQRMGAQSLPLNDPEKVLALTYAKGASTYEDQEVLLDPEKIVQSLEIKNFLAGYSPKTDPLDFIVSQHLLNEKNWNPKIAGLLLFSDNPSTLIPKKCAVKIIRYETKEEIPEREHLREQYTLEAPLYQLISQTIKKIAEIMSSIKVLSEEGELKTVDYPPEAIWEIIVNAIIHRDYSISDDVRVTIYDNRIEVVSPGRLPGYVTVDNILDARYSRNPKIVRTLNRYDKAPNKDLGEGLNTAFQKMKEWKLKSPEIKEEGNYVKVTIPHAPLGTPAELILYFLKEKGLISNKQAREITGIKSENSVKREFYKLRDTGLLEKIPSKAGKYSAWRLTRKGKKEVEQ